MRKKIFFLMVILVYLVTSLVGCTEALNRDIQKTEIPMTGFEDFHNRIFEGDKILVVYGSVGNEISEYLLSSFARILQRKLNIQREGQLEIKVDNDVTEDDINSKHIILLGNPETNTYYSEVNDQLPIVVEGAELVIGKEVINDPKTVFNFLVPNPKNQSKYLLVYGAVNEEYFPYIQFLSLNNQKEEYVIKCDKITRYSGKFIKEENGWEITKLGQTTKQIEFVTAESEHFIFHYDEIDKQVADSIDGKKTIFESIYVELSAKIGSYEDKIDVYFFLSQNIKDYYVRRDDDFWLGSIYITADKASVHEYKYEIARLLMNQKGYPLNEFTLNGILNVLSREDINENIRGIIETEQYIPLNYLTDYQIDQNFDQNIVDEEVTSFANFLVQEYGFETYMRFYDLNTGDDLYNALKEAYEKDIFVLEDEWINSLLCNEQD